MLRPAAAHLAHNIDLFDDIGQTGGADEPQVAGETEQLAQDFKFDVKFVEAHQDGLQLTSIVGLHNQAHAVQCRILNLLTQHEPLLLGERLHFREDPETRFPHLGLDDEVRFHKSQEFKKQESKGGDISPSNPKPDVAVRVRRSVAQKERQDAGVRRAVPSPAAKEAAKRRVCGIAVDLPDTLGTSPAARASNAGARRQWIDGQAAIHEIRSVVLRPQEAGAGRCAGLVAGGLPGRPFIHVASHIPDSFTVRQQKGAALVAGGVAGAVVAVVVICSGSQGVSRGVVVMAAVDVAAAHSTAAPVAWYAQDVLGERHPLGFRDEVAAGTGRLGGGDGAGLADGYPWGATGLAGRDAADVLGFVLSDAEVAGAVGGAARHGNEAGGATGAIGQDPRTGAGCGSRLLVGDSVAGAAGGDGQAVASVVVGSAVQVAVPAVGRNTSIRQCCRVDIVICDAGNGQLLGGLRQAGLHGGFVGAGLDAVERHGSDDGKNSDHDYNYEEFDDGKSRASAISLMLREMKRTARRAFGIGVGSNSSFHYETI